MAEERKIRNFVLLVGALKETTLEMKSGSDGKRFIAGNVTVAIDEFNTHRVRFFVTEDKQKDKFDELSKFLPDNVVSVASYLKANPSAVFAIASNMAAKIWVTGSLEEYVKISGENENSSVTINGNKISFSDPEKYEPKAVFELDAHIASMEDEVDDEIPTGRVLLGLYAPGYKGIVHKINVVVPIEKNAAAYVKEKYKVGDSIALKGNLVAMRVQLVDESDEGEGEGEDAFGEPMGPQYTTYFVREMVVTGGNRIDALFTKKQLTEGLVARNEAAVARAKKQKEKAAETATAETSADDVEDGAKETNKDDFDF